MANESNAGVLESSRVASAGFTNSATAVLPSIPAPSENFRNLWAALRTLQGQDVVHCPAEECSDSDLNLTVPLSAPVMVGQRYEIAVENRDPIAGQALSLADGQYATVFRTEIVNAPGGKSLRVGLRLDQPLSF